MSKRLEEIKEIFGVHKIQTFADRKTIPFNLDDIEWLIKQAERAEELDKLNEQIIETADKIDERNQRYREAIEEAIEYANSPKILTSPAGIEEILSKALEGDNE